MSPRTPSVALAFAASLALGLALGAGTELVPLAERALAPEAAAQGVPVMDGSALGQVVARLSALGSDLGVQADRNAARADMAAVEAEQLAVLDRMTAALGGGPGGSAYAPPADLEGDGPLGAAAVYPPGPGGPMDERLFGEGRESVESMIVRVSAEYAPRAASVGLSPTQFRALFQALVKQESAFDVHARSHVGAYGLAQLMPGTAAELGRDPSVPLENLRGGADYLTQQLARFGNVPHALAAYNAGPGAVQKHRGIPPYAETQGYVRRITGYYNEYLGRIGGADALGTLDASDFALAEYASASGAASSYAAGSHGSAVAAVARLRAIVEGVDAQPDVARAVAHNTYARAELGRALATRVRLLAAKSQRQAAHGQHLAAERLAERRFMRMGVGQ